MSPAALTVLSPCKFNLFLAVGPARPDGYHELVTVMEPLNLCDRLVLEEIEAGRIEVACSDPAVPSGPDNLVYRAATEFRRAAGIERGVRIVLEKGIPAAAGLGGGSGDAATTILALERLWGSELPREQARRICAGLGSDVAFFLDPRTSLCRGRGEAVAALPPAPPLHAVLVNPGLPLPTAWAYRQLDLNPPPAPPALEPLLAALEAGDLEKMAGCLYNAFQPLACRRYPEVDRAVAFLDNLLPLGALLAGSGATVVGLAATGEEAAAAAERVRTAFPGTFVAVADNRLPEK